MLYYVAHPVSPDDVRTYVENVKHALRCLRALHDAGFECICPWYTDLHYLDDTDPEHRDRALKRDCEVIRKIGGNVILTGHKISAGMQLEMIAGMEVGGHIIDLLGFEPENYHFTSKRYAALQEEIKRLDLYPGDMIG